MTDIFYFTKKEQSQLIKLLLIISCLFAIKQLTQKDHPIKINETIIEPIPIKETATERHKPAIKQAISMHSFNPNTVSEIELKAMSLPQKGIKSLLKYRQKGGRIRDIKGFKRMYGFENLPDSLLIQYLVFEKVNQNHIKQEESKYIAKTKTSLSKSRVIEKDSANNTAEFQTYDSSSTKSPSLKERLYIGINTADTSRLQQLKGIGPLRAKMIVKFRRALGGYHSLSQLHEVHYLPDSIVEKISHQIYLDSIPIRKIKMNRATEKELAMHPYIDWQEAKMIHNFTKEHGPIRDLNELYQLRGLDSSFINRVIPYIDIDE